MSNQNPPELPNLPSPLDKSLDQAVWGVFYKNKNFDPELIGKQKEKKYSVKCKSNGPLSPFLKLDSEGVPVLSITLFNKFMKPHGFKLNVIDADWYGKYKQNFDQELFKDLYTQTYTEFSPSGNGAHVFLMLPINTSLKPFDGSPIGLDVRTNGFVTMTFRHFPGSPDQIAVSRAVIESSEKASGRFKREDWEPMDPFNKDGSLSPIWCFNMQTDPTVLLDDHPDYERYGSRYLYIPSSSKNPGVMIYQGMKGDWDGVVSYHDDELPNEFLDPWGVHQAFKGKKYSDKDSLRDLSRTVKAIDPETGEMLDISVDEFNQRKLYTLPVPLLKEIADEIFLRMRFPSHPIASIFTLIIASKLTARHYKDGWQDAPGSLYALILGPTGIGKELIIWMVDNLYGNHAAFQAKGKPQSASGFIADMRKDPASVHIIDEFGMKLDERDKGFMGLMSEMMQTYGRSEGRHYPGSYSEHKMGEKEKAKNGEPIFNPTNSLLAVSTWEVFVKALGFTDIVSGAYSADGEHPF